MKSGIPDFDTAKPWGPDGPVDPLRATIYKNPTHCYSPADLLSVPWVHTKNLTFAPGSCPPHHGNCYSSTNFVLLGLLLAHHQDPKSSAIWKDYNQSKAYPVSVVKDFPKVSFATTGPPEDHTTVHGYDMTSYNHKKPEDSIDVYSTCGVFGGWTASDIVGPAQDIAALVYDVYAPVEANNGSKIVRDGKLLAQMYGSSGDTGYGLATFNLSHHTGVKGPEGIAYGHLGATYGYQSIVAYFPALDFSLAIGTNTETDYQSQPSDTMCRVYNTIKASIEGKAKPP